MCVFLCSVGPLISVFSDFEIVRQCHNAENSCFTPDGTFFVLSGPSIQASKGLVVCVHGLGGSHLVFEQLCHELNHAGFATLMFDNFGRGRSAIASDGDYSEDGHIKQIENLLSYLGVFSTSKQTDNQTLMDACGTRDQFGCALNEIPIHLIGHSVCHDHILIDKFVYFIFRFLKNCTRWAERWHRCSLTSIARESAAWCWLLPLV
jgi:hypothetical protein